MKTAVVVFLFWILSSAQNVPAPAFIVANPSSRNSLILRTHGIITSTKGNESKYVFDREFMSTRNRTDFQLAPTKDSKLPNGIEIIVKVLEQYQDYELILQFEQTKIVFQRHNETNFVTLDEEQLDTQRAFVFSLNILPNSALYVAAGRQRYYNLTKKFTFFDRFVQKLPVRFGFDIKMPATSVVVVFKFSEIVELEISSRSKQKAEDKKTDDLVNGIVPALLIGIVPLVVGLLVIYHYTRIRTRTPPMSTIGNEEFTLHFCGLIGFVYLSLIRSFRCSVDRTPVVLLSLQQLFAIAVNVIRTLVQILKSFLETIVGGENKNARNVTMDEPQVVKPSAEVPHSKPLSPFSPNNLTLPTPPSTPDFVRVNPRDPHYQTLAMFGNEDVFKKKE